MTQTNQEVMFVLTILMCVIMDSEAEQECIDLNINYQGADYTILVDLQTANVLLNDPDQAELYMEQMLNKENVNKPSTSRSTLSVAGNLERNLYSDSSVDETEKKIIWSGRKPTELDNVATEYFLFVREKYSEKFDDKRTVKSQIWLKIGEEMNNAGYYVGQGKAAVEKLRLKFSNLQKQYLAHVRHMNTTGETHKDPPPFFDILHSILGAKDKVNPTNTQDTLDTEREIETEHSESEDKDITDSIKNRFHSEKKTVRPKSVNTQLLELLKEQHEADIKERQEQFKSLENLLRVQNDQRDRLINQFERFVDIKSQKRKRSSSDSD